MNNGFQIRAYLVKGLGDIHKKLVWVNDKNYMLVRKRLELEKKRAIAILVNMKWNGSILSISRPKGYGCQSALDELMDAKKDINKAISKIKEFYYK